MSLVLICVFGIQLANPVMQSMSITKTQAQQLGTDEAGKTRRQLCTKKFKATADLAWIEVSQTEIAKGE